MPAADERGGYSPPRRLKRLPSWLVAQLAKSAQAIVGASLAGEGARRPQYTVLTALAEEGAASQAELGRRLWIDRSEMHAILNELEEQGLVARVRHEDDRRRNLVRITPAGTTALGRLDSAVDEAQRALLEPLSAAERREFVRLLDRLVEHHRDDPPSPRAS